MPKVKQPVRAYRKGKRQKIAVPVRRYSPRVEALLKVMAAVMMEPANS